MSENVVVDLPGEMISTTEKIGLQKLLQSAQGAAPAVVKGVFSTGRPWTQFVATKNFKAPTVLPGLTLRFYRNIQYFKSNYIMVFLGLFAYCVFMSPFLLITMIASFYGYKKLTSGPKTWKIGNWELTKSQQHVIVAGCTTIVLWFAGIGAAFFWVLGATVIVVGLHASFFNPEALMISNDPEQVPMIEQV
ncbi:unnamed protein product [Leptosia nina]|uniref:PRA1 family protein n=1 Tax=Leptosia nina TaxID=320188 RepID=A0AAV1JIM3_9NEOP